MENHLYWITDLVYVVVLAIILRHSYIYRDEISPLNRAFRKLLAWSVFFCFQDAVWELSSFEAVGIPSLFFVTSTVFHVCTIVSAYFWLDFLLTFLRKGIQHQKAFRVFGVVIVSLQLILVVRNFFYPTIFSISEDNAYVAESLRWVAMLAPHLIIVVAGLVMAYFCIKNSRKDDGRQFPVLMFVIMPFIFGILQLQFSGCPFNSMSYFIGCCIVHIFIAAREHNERMTVEANTDGLTKVFNRHAMEEDAKRYRNDPLEDSAIVYSIDINGLKQVNDSLGQEAGNELVLAAAACISRAFGSKGKVYRYGGEEFMVLARFDGDGTFFKTRLLNEVSRWQGQKVKELALSIGFAEKRNFPMSDVVELKAIADNMMRLDKSNYYRNKGVDRRKLREAFGAVCNSYTKILKLNLATDTFDIVQMDPSERNPRRGFSTEHSKWLENYARQGRVYIDDVKNFLQQTDLENLRKHFVNGRKSFSFVYRKNTKLGVETALMELLRASDYTDESPNVFLYVKSMNTSVKKSD